MKREKGFKQCLKLLLTALLFVMVLTTGVKAQAETWIEINEKNFPDSGVREVLKGKVPYDDNFKLSDGKFYVNVSGVTDFNCYGDNIESYGFLKKFTRLESVTLFNITTKSVDFTKNSKLNKITISGAPSLVSVKCPKGVQFLKVENANISRLDVSGLQNLETLIVRDDPNLRNIDVSKNKKLEKLEASGTAVRSIDVRKCKRLTSLECYKAKLSDLKIGKNTNIKSINVSGNKKLTNLDTSMCPNLEEVTASDTGISKLDFTKNRNLQMLFLSNAKIKTLNVTKCHKLSMLNVSGTLIKSLNVTKCYKLSYLNVSDTAIKTLNVTKNRNLESIVMYRTKKLKRLNVTRCPKLEGLRMTGSGIAYINLGKNKKLIYLEPSNTRMKAAGLKGRTFMELGYTGLKKGSVVPLKDIIGSGYKLSTNNNNIRFNPKTMKFQILRTNKYSDQVRLKKGNNSCTIYIDYIGN